MHKFKMKILNNQKCFLGINVIFTDECVKLHQQSDYTTRLLERFGMENSHGKVTPMEMNTSITRSGKDGSTEFTSLVGGLLYLARNPKLNILYAMNYLSRF